MMFNSPVNIFIIYSRKDLEYHDMLKKHLNLLKNNGNIVDIWSDGKILPGENWDDVIKQKLKAAEIILMLISADFFDSEYILKDELTLAFKQHSNNTSVVIPILVRNCLWTVHKDISALQILPRNAEPVATWKHLDEAYTSVIAGIDSSIKGFFEKRFTTLGSLLTMAMEFYNAEQYGQAYDYFAKILPTGHPLDSEAAFRYAKILNEGLGNIPQNSLTAVHWYQYSANLGNTKSQNNLGVMYEKGEGVALNIDNAIFWYSKSAEGGNILASRNLGLLFYFGVNIKKDYHKALKNLTVVAQDGDPYFQYLISDIYLNQNLPDVFNKNEGFYWLKKSLDQNYPKAQCLWGAIQMDGHITEKNVTSGLIWLNHAADQDDLDALLILGDIFNLGEDVTKSTKKAIEYYEKAANLGSSRAHDRIDELYKR